ncbi:MAG: Rrf2 family transcriptional regulator [Spirochaetota bacterium]
MKVSTIGRYATCALICLAERYGKGPTSLSKIANEQQISVKYLENIMRIFISHGVVATTKGAHGGFTLTKNPRTVRMGDVITLAEGVVLPIHCMEDSDLCPRRGTCPAKYMWRDLQNGIIDSLNRNTLYSLAQQKKKLAQEKPKRRQSA